jgi:hypothetical protein
MREVHTSNALRLEWSSTTGFDYQPEYSTDLIHWSPYGPMLPGNDSDLYLNPPISLNPARQYFRVQVPLP